MRIAARTRWALVLANLAACALFVALRPPAPPEYIADIAEARATGGFVINSGISGMVACEGCKARRECVTPWSYSR
jgi:hypothetical protein